MSAKHCNYVYKNGPDYGCICNDIALAVNKCKFHSHPIFLFEDNKDLSKNYVKEIATWIREHPHKIWDDMRNDYNKNGTDEHLYLTYLWSIENGDRFIIAYEEDI